MFFVAVYGCFKISNSKHQISNKSQIPKISNINDLDNCDVDEDAFFNLLPFFKNIRFGILNFGHWGLFGNWDLLFGISTQTAPILNEGSFISLIFK
ncbi:MAG: hypothetical protein C0611_05550, partial [Desulfobacteraceae bacterium]